MIEGGVIIDNVTAYNVSVVTHLFYNKWKALGLPACLRDFLIQLLRDLLIKLQKEICLNIEDVGYYDNVTFGLFTVSPEIENILDPLIMKSETTFMHSTWHFEDLLISY